MSESQDTSAEPGPRCEAGEELFRKEFIPLGVKMEQLTRSAQKQLTLSTTELVRRDGPHETMTGRAGIVLLNQPTALGQGGQLAPQPSQHPPDGAVGQRSLVDGRGIHRRLVAPYPSSWTGRFPIGLLVVVNVTGGQEEQRGACVAFVGEYESRGNR